MGTAVETEAEIDAVMKATGEAVGLLLDTGHLVFAGGDNASVIQNMGADQSCAYQGYPRRYPAQC